MTTSLRDLFGVLDELQACKDGLTHFDHVFGLAIDEVTRTERIWKNVEAQASKAARADAPKAATATEINGLITTWVNDRPSAVEARENHAKAEADLKKVERWIRSLEQRLKTAQTAKGVHEQLMQGGGG